MLRRNKKATTAKAPRSSAGIAAPEYTPRVAARAIDGHILRTGQQTFAWYRLAPQRWSFRSDAQRNELIRAIAGQYAELQGRWLHLRATSSPYPIDEWAKAHVANSRNRPPTVPGALSWADYIVGEQEHLVGTSLSEKEVYLGVQVQTRTAIDLAVERAAPLLRRLYPAAVDAELTALDSEIEHLDQVIAATGLEGTPATAEQMRWLMHRSTALGLPAPEQRPAGTGQWEATDLDALTSPAAAYQEPYAPTVTVRGRTGAHAGHTAHVTVLSVGLSQQMQIPELHDPWVQRADRLPAPLEWSARIYVRTPDEVASELQRQNTKVRSQQRHYLDEHGLEAPRALERQINAVGEIDDQMTSGFTALSTRVKSWWRVAVSGADEQESLRHAQTLIDIFKPHLTLEHPEGQYALAREFIPGEAMATSAYLRRGSVVWAASAVPQATSEAGDRRGILLGETDSASRRPVAWDPWMSQEIRDASGLTALVGGLGSGKSFLGGGIVYKTLRAGAHWTVLDPSGPLAELCKLPELAPFARTIDLLNAEPGILNPYRVVPEPNPDDFATRADFHREQKNAHATRRRLTLDLLTNVLPVTIAAQPETKMVLLKAVREVGGSPQAHPGLVIDALTQIQDENRAHAQSVHEFLDELRDRLGLMIPEDNADPYAHQRDDRLTVLTMPGLALPKDGTGREHWTDAEAIAVELLNLAAWLTQRTVYERPKSERKGVWIDEAFFLSEVPTGRVLMNRFSRDSRKWNVRVLLSSQVPSDFLRIEGFASLLDSVFVGRLDDEPVQADALRLLGVPTGAGYEPIIGGLSQNVRARTRHNERTPRQFIFADGAGGVERIRIDFSGDHLRHLCDALATTPGDRDGEGTAGDDDLDDPVGDDEFDALLSEPAQPYATNGKGQA